MKDLDLAWQQDFDEEFELDVQVEEKNTRYGEEQHVKSNTFPRWPSSVLLKGLGPEAA